MIIKTNTEEFKNDLYDIIHMFYPNSELGEEDMIFNHEMLIEEDKIINKINLDSNDFINEQDLIYFKSNLFKKKILKRYVKLSMYKFLSKITGKTMPWGSLTGIRPTKLAYDLIEEGIEPVYIKETLMRNFIVSEPKAKLVAKIIANQNCIIKNDKLADIYINIPICPSRCSYCSFISAEYEQVKDLIPRYLDALVKELKSIKELVHKKSYIIRSIYIGGGTPSVLSAKELEKIFQEINYPISEFTVECGRPETITEEKLTALKSAGVTRISINPQTFCQKTLKTIGRKHTIQDVLNAYKLALKYGFIVNMDFIAGLPGEKLSTFKKNINTALELSPDNITIHTLSIKHGSVMFNNPPESPENVAKMVSYAYEKLAEDGYLPYYMYRQKNQVEGLENVGYTKKGKICIFNVDSMEETCNIIACGASAISKRVFQLENRIERQANPKFLSDYIQRIDEMIENKYRLF